VIIREKTASAGVVASIGGLAALVPVFDMTQDVFVGGKPVWSTLVENAALLVVGFTIVAAGGWLAASDWDAKYVRTTARLSVANVLGVAALIAVVVSIQVRVQGDLKPLVLAADAVVVGAVGGVVLGFRTAQSERAKDDAAAQRDRFQALFENVPNPIVGVEFVGNVPVVRAVNPAFNEKFGFGPEEIVGESLEAYIAPPEQDIDPVGDEGAVGAPETPSDWDRNVIELETVDGRREFIRLTAPVERGPERDGYTVFIDVTAERQRRERLQVLSRTLRHDIRNQLNVVEGSMRELAERLDGENAEMADIAAESARDLLEMSQQTRHVDDRVGGGVDPSPVDLTDVVRDVVDDVTDAYDADVEVDLPDAATGVVSSSFPTAVEEVVTNAIEHSDRERPSVEVSIEEARDGEYHQIRVADRGPGIRDEQVAVIEGDVEHTQTQHLGGLGLWTARWVMQNTGGTIEFADNDPRGTVVALSVPRPVADGGRRGGRTPP